MTILIHFHQSHYRDFKADYLFHVGQHWAEAFANRLSDNRWVAVIPTALVPRWVYLQPPKGQATGIAFIDATSRVGCHNRRIDSHQVFKKLARRGQTSVGWFYGFKLHLVVNAGGELLALQVTPGNGDDRRPVPRLAQGLTGQLFGERGYISPTLVEALLEQDRQRIPKLRKGRDHKLLSLADTLLLRNRALIATLNDQLKNISQIEHPRPRSVSTRMVHLLAGLGAYPHQPTTPSLDLSQNQLKRLNYQA